MSASDERCRRPSRRQRRGVIAAQHQIAGRGGLHGVPPGLGMGSPQQVYRRPVTALDRADQLPGQTLPALSRMTGRPVLLYGEASIEQQHPLTCPRFERARQGKRDTEIPMQLLKDVAQAGRLRHAIGDRKCQAVGLPRSVVGVLSQNHHTNSLRRRQFQRPERVWRKDCCTLGQPSLNEAAQALTGRGIQKTGDFVPPKARRGCGRRPGSQACGFCRRRPRFISESVQGQLTVLHACGVTGLPWLCRGSAHSHAVSNSWASAAPGSDARMKASPTRKA